jgi:membrane fusion protein, multidrug efflux system
LLSFNTNKIIQWGFLALIGSGLLTGCGKKSQSAPDQAVTKSEGRVIPVEVVTAMREDFAVTKSFTGALEGSEQASIVARIPERVVAIKTAVGNAVSKDQTVIVLDKGGPSSQYLQAEAGYSSAEKNLARMKALYQAGAVSLQALEGSQTSYDVAKANFDASQQSIVLTAPIEGVVTAIKIEVGDMANPGTVLATIAKVDNMKVIFNMNEGDVFDLALGQTVLINSETRSGGPVEGKITEYFKSADSQSRTFEVRAQFPNTPDRWFKPGMFVKVSYGGNAVPNALLIPNQAILSDGVTNRLFTVRQGRAFQKTIVTGISDGLKTVIRDGISDKDTVVTVGWNNLHDSSSVMIVSPGK